MGRRDQYREQLRVLPAEGWPAHLREHSGLPGPRADLELAVAADPAAGLPRFRALSGYGDRDVDWIVRENSRKARLAKIV
jgi:hypothetical protein